MYNIIDMILLMGLSTINIFIRHYILVDDRDLWLIFNISVTGAPKLAKKEVILYSMLS